MARKPETLTCHQVWKRYYNAYNRSDELRSNWKRTVSKLHDTEYRIDMVKESLRKEYEKLPAKELNKAIPLDVQEKIFFLRHELAALCGLRKELHAIIIIYKRQCEEATTRANRYKMAYNRLKPIACERIPEGCEKPGKFIDEFKCKVFTNKNGRIDIEVESDGISGRIEFSF